MNKIYIIDDFYDDVQSIINMAICDQPSPCPGMRSHHIDIIDMSFYKAFRKKIFDLHNIVDNGKYGLTTYFNQITAFDEDILNYNWPHIDGDIRYGDTSMTPENYHQKITLGGMIILCDIVDNLNTDFWMPSYDIDKNELFKLLLYDYIVTRDQYENGQLTLDKFKQKFNIFHNKFKLDISIPNKKNRMISWNSGSIRGQKMISKKQVIKLTHNFYIYPRQ